MIVITSDSSLGDEGERAAVHSKNSHHLCIVRGGRIGRRVNAAEEVASLVTIGGRRVQDGGVRGGEMKAERGLIGGVITC